MFTKENQELQRAPDALANIYSIDVNPWSTIATSLTLIWSYDSFSRGNESGSKPVKLANWFSPHHHTIFHHMQLPHPQLMFLMLSQWILPEIDICSEVAINCCMLHILITGERRNFHCLESVSVPSAHLIAKKTNCEWKPLHDYTHSRYHTSTIFFDADILPRTWLENLNAHNERPLSALRCQTRPVYARFDVYKHQSMQQQSLAFKHTGKSISNASLHKKILFTLRGKSF